MRAKIVTMLLVASLAAAIPLACAGGPMKDMLEAIRDDARETEDYTGKDHISARVLDAMSRVPRDVFVPDSVAHLAYVNTPLGIGYGQTISQPFIVALMTDLMQPRKTDRVLEIGTGSGYQAAVLAELVASVYTIEIVPELAERAGQTLDSQGYTNVHVRAGDGWFGWPEVAPFDAIIVTAVADEVPPKLLDQLKAGGRLVMPLGNPRGAQTLAVIEKDAHGDTNRRDVLPVMFVPLTGDH